MHRIILELKEISKSIWPKGPFNLGTLLWAPQIPLLSGTRRA